MKALYSILRQPQERHSIFTQCELIEFNFCFNFVRLKQQIEMESKIFFAVFVRINLLDNSFYRVGARWYFGSIEKSKFTIRIMNSGESSSRSESMYRKISGFSRNDRSRNLNKDFPRVFLSLSDTDSKKFESREIVLPICDAIKTAISRKTKRSTSF
jgi:hypothetical protein